MLLNLILDAAAQAAPAAIKQAWQTAADMIDGAVSDNITVNIKVTYGGANGASGGASAGPDGGQLLSYQTVQNYLLTKATGGDSTFTALPNGTSIGGQSQVAVWNAQLKLMGLVSPNDTATDDAQADFGTGISAASMVGVALHEFTHGMGRVPDGPTPDIFDFYRFTGPGTYLFQNGNTAPASYFSLDGGITKWADYGQTSDPSDTLNPPNSALTPNDPFNELYNSNTLQYLTPFDLEQMDALGYHLLGPITAPASDAHDFNGDNSADILVQNSSTGNIVYAAMSGGNFIGWANIATTPGWTVVGEGKMSGGTSSEVVIQNASGQILYTNGNGNFQSVGNTPGWKVVGVGNISGSFHQGADVVAQNQTNGQIAVWVRTSAITAGWNSVGTTPGFNVVAVADVNFEQGSSGRAADVIIQNPTTGEIDYDATSYSVFSTWIGIAKTPGWNVVGAGDINRDGYADIVIQSASTGQILCADMHGGQFNSWVTVGNGSTPGWNVVAVENVMGNGYDDIVIQNASTGQLLFADMTGGSFQSWKSIASAPGYTGKTDGAIGGTVDGLSVSDPGAQRESIGAMSMFDPGPSNGALGPLSVSDPGAQGDAIGAIRMFDPGQEDSALSGTSVSDPGPEGSIVGSLTMFDPGPQNAANSLTAGDLLTHSLNDRGIHVAQQA